MTRPSFPMPFADSIALLNASVLRVFGETVSYRSDGGKGDPVDVSVVWDDNPANMPEGIRAVAWGLASAFPAVAAGDLIDRGLNTYKIADAPVPDGMGKVTMNLRHIGKARE